MSNADLYRELIAKVWYGEPTADVSDRVAAEYVGHDPLRPRKGPEQYAGMVSELRAALTGLEYEVVSTIEQDDLVAARWRLTGKHTGPLFGIAATGALVDVTGMTMNRFIDGKIVEGWIQWDVIKLLQDLGQSTIHESMGEPAAPISDPPPAPAV